MLSFIKRLFSKNIPEKEKDFTATAYELWSTNFSDPKKERFIEEKDEGYSASFEKGLCLSLNRKNIYAWTVNPQYQYKNLSLDAVIDFSETARIIPETQSNEENQAGICAFGFLLRYVDEANHLCFLVSDKGFFRIDAVFNGNQMPLIGWTAIPTLPKKYAKRYEKHHIPIQIVLNETGIAVIINCTLALLLDDDTIQSEGYTAFAGQNWEQYETVCARLCFFSIESRELQTDAAYRAWSEDNNFSSKYLIQLARSYSAVGRIVPALIEIKKALEKGISSIDDCLFASRLYLSQNLYDEAQNVLEKARIFFNDDISIIEEYASVLYVSSQYNAFDKLFNSLGEKAEGSSLLASLKGHALALQHDYKNAHAWYMKATRLDPKQLMHGINAADMLRKTGDKDQSTTMYLSLLNDCIEQRNFEFCNIIQEKLHDIKLNQKQKARILACNGKEAYITGNRERAIECLEEYLSKRLKNKDSEALFALALIYKEDKRVDEAIVILEKITIGDEAKPEYHRNLAELYSLKGNTDKATIEIEKTLALNPSDGWALFLKAQLLCNDAQFDKALNFMYSALAVLPEELCVLNLYAKLMNEKGRIDEVLPILDAASEHSGSGSSYRTDALHLCANYLKDLGRTEEAETRYKRALSLSPKDTKLICDYTSLLLKQDRLNEADNLLTKVFSQSAPVEYYLLIARIAVKKGDFVRSEMALRQGLELYEKNDYEYCTLLIDLAHLYIIRDKITKAQETVDEILSIEKSERTEEILDELTEKTHRKICCAICNRTWKVPQHIVPARMHLTAEPPEDLPAGNCPQCGKVYCIGCVKNTLSPQGKFSCPQCGLPLKIQDKGIFWLLNTWNKENTE